MGIIYYYYNRWRANGTIKGIHEVLRNTIRKRKGREESPSLGIIDSQSSKTTQNEGIRQRNR